MAYIFYSYYCGINRLQAVTDAITADNKMGDFTDKNTTATDYGYDKNGNLVTDLNKRLNGSTGSELTSGGAIVYNYLNLPESIAVKNDNGSDKGTITYTYDAAGNKLKKEVAELGQPTKTTLYLGGQIYENDVLQFIGMEEGRVRPIINASNQLQSFAFDYMLKDHLGNVRMVLTDEVKEDMYPAATLELANSVTENLLYGNIDNTRYVKPSWFSDPLYSSSEKVSKVKNETGSQKIGPNIILKVMAGDTYNIRVASGWTGSSPTNGTSNLVLTDLFSSLINGIVGVSAGKAVLGDLQNTNSGINNSLQNFLSTQPNISGKPKAYINWVLFDEQFKMVASNSSFQQVAASGITNIHAINNLPINKSGYLYIYTSNESNNTDVFFDNLQVTHTKGPMLEETHYYPFGLVMQGISSKVAEGTDNKKKYNGYELNTDFDINLNESFYRSHDPQLGRFWQLDPKPDERISLYSAMGNNPISLNDLLGDTTRYYNNDGNLLYTTYAKGYNHATIVGDKQLKGFNKIVGGLGKLSINQQAAFDKIAGMLYVGTTYDIGAMSSFYANEADKNNATSMNGTPISSMENLKFNGKSIDPKSIKAETSADLVINNGKVTVGNLRYPNTELTNTYPPDNMGSQAGYTGAHIHTHPNRPDGAFTWSKGSQHSTLNIYSANGPSPADQSRTSGDMNYNNVRNVVADKNYIYLINGSDKQTIKIPR